MILKFLRIIILFIAFNFITSCNPDTCYLDDCSDKEKMKISLLKFYGDNILEDYRNIDSLDWFFSETDSIFVVNFIEKEEIRKHIIYDGNFNIIVSKKDCKATIYKYRYRNGQYERY